MRRALILLALAGAAWCQPIPPAVKQPCSGSVTTNCTPQVNGAGTYVPPAGGGGGTGNAASVVIYTPGASVTMTCPSSTAGTVTIFDPNGAALAANMAVSFAACKTGQVVIVRVTQAASGGPFTVSGLPTGSPQISTYASATTIYTLQASSATTMNFVNVAANSGSSSLGTGANGISRTVTAGSGGVTANLLAAKDASNPTKYVLPAAGDCGAGVAAYAATSGNLFELYQVPGTVLTMVADGTITAGHLLTGGSSTVGRVADTGQTARTSVAVGTCVLGVALASATVGNTVLVAYNGTGIYGANNSAIGVATATTLAIGGCTIGTDILCSVASGGVLIQQAAGGQFTVGAAAGQSPSSNLELHNTTGSAFLSMCDDGASTEPKCMQFGMSAGASPNFEVFNTIHSDGTGVQTIINYTAAAGIQINTALNANNTTIQQGSNPTLVFNESGGSTNAKQWEIQEVSSAFWIRAPQDSFASAALAMEITKTAGTPPTITGMWIPKFIGWGGSGVAGANAGISSSGSGIVAIGTGTNASVAGKLALTPGATVASDVQVCWQAANGNVLTQGATCGVSLAAYKRDVAPVVHGLDYIMRMRPVTFDWRDTGKPDIGMIADEVATIDPLFGAYNVETGALYNFRDRPVIATLVKAVQELHQEILSLKGNR